LDHFSDVLNIDDLNSVLDRCGNLQRKEKKISVEYREDSDSEGETHIVLDIRFASYRCEDLLDSRSVSRKNLLLETTDR